MWHCLSYDNFDDVEELIDFITEEIKKLNNGCFLISALPWLMKANVMNTDAMK